MTAFDTLNSARRLERGGFTRDQSEAIASEIRSGILPLVTHDQLKAALDAQTIRICSVLGGLMALGFAGVTIAISLS